MLTRLSKHKNFDYTPRFYNPDKEKDKHHNIRFTRLRSRRKSYSIIWLLALMGIILFLLISLSNVSKYF